MDRRLADLLKQFELERLEVNLFRGESRDIGSPQVYGGQVLGQALMAASSTLPPELVVHSLHAYFLRRGDFNLPIVYQVDRSRDGHSFSSRRVIAIQNGQQIFTFSASFQKPEAGFDHQVDMPEVPPPEDLPDWDRPTPEVAASLPETTRPYLARERPFQMRPVGLLSAIHPVAGAPLQRVWFRLVDRLPDDAPLHRCLLAYMSDFALLGTALRPHAAVVGDGTLMMASIDHAMWFHRDFRLDDWLLYSLESPSASGARGFARGSIYTRDGRLAASVAQEGLIRLVAKQGESKK